VVTPCDDSVINSLNTGPTFLVLSYWNYLPKYWITKGYELLECVSQITCWQWQVKVLFPVIKTWECLPVDHCQWLPTTHVQSYKFSTGMVECPVYLWLVVVVHFGPQDLTVTTGWYSKTLLIQNFVIFLILVWTCAPRKKSSYTFTGLFWKPW
jgi:hypothetical protein